MSSAKEENLLSALAGIKDETLRQTADVIALRAEVAALCVEVAALRAVVAARRHPTPVEEAEVMRDPDTYHAIGFFPDPPCGDFMEDFSEVDPDYGYNRPMPGKRAREALKPSDDERSAVTDYILKIEAENAALVEALKPFAKMADDAMSYGADQVSVSVIDLVRARNVLSGAFGTDATETMRAKCEDVARRMGEEEIADEIAALKDKP